MAFKKADRSHLAQKNFSDKKAQSIFEYVILTAVVVTTVLIFGPYFGKIKDSCDKAFNAAVTEIVK
ncbi:MAG: hypothetical protein PHG87_07185 [Candidatus Omnitrophica bacterium]|nr:hypothetical protein [Candidatus Omnitrophota bacterium]